MRRFLFLFIAVAIALALGCSPGTSQSPTATTTSTAPTTTLNPTPTPTVTFNLTASTWANIQGYAYTKPLFVDTLKNIEDNSGGRIKFKSYLEAQLFAGADELAALDKGAVDILPLWSPLYNTKDDPIFGFASLPFAFDSPEHFLNAWNNGMGDIISKHVAKWNVVTLSVTPVVGTVGIDYKGTQPPRSPDNIKGVKIRTADAYQKYFFESLGGTGVFVTAPEMYVTMQRGVVDMAVDVWGGRLGYKMYEVTDGFLNMNMYPATAVCLVNKNTWGKLPPDLQKLLSDVFKTAVTNFIPVLRTGEEENKRQILAKKPNDVLVDLTPQERVVWVQAAKNSVWKYFADQSGPDGQKYLDVLDETR